MFLHVSVHRGVSAPLHVGIHPHPRNQRQAPSPPPQGLEAGTPSPDQRQARSDQRQAPPPGADTPHPVQCMLGDTGNKRAVRILLECNLVLIYVHGSNENKIITILWIPIKRGFQDSDSTYPER